MKYLFFMMLSLGMVGTLQAQEDPFLREGSQQGYLGFSADYQRVGSLGELNVFWVNPRGPGVAAGLVKDDVIVAINDNPLTFSDHAEFRQSIGWIKVGVEVELTVRRGSEMRELKVRAVPVPEKIKAQIREGLERSNRHRPMFALVDIAAQGGGRLTLYRQSSGLLRLSAPQVDSFDEPALVELFERGALAKFGTLVQRGEALELKLSYEENGNETTTEIEVVGFSSQRLRQRIEKSGITISDQAEIKETEILASLH